MVRGETDSWGRGSGSLPGRKDHLKVSGCSCVCGSSADVSVLAAAPLRLSLFAHLVSRALCTWLVIKFCSLPWNLAWNPDPLPGLTSGNFIFLHPILPSGSLVPCLPWPRMTVSQSVFCLPGSWQHLETLLFSCHSPPQHYLFLSWDLRMGFIEAEWGSKIC